MAPTAGWHELSRIRAAGRAAALARTLSSGGAGGGARLGRPRLIAAAEARGVPAVPKALFLARD